MGDTDRVGAFTALLQLPTDPTIAGRFGHRLTAPYVPVAERRLAEYVRRSIIFLMERDLDRYGDL